MLSALFSWRFGTVLGFISLSIGSFLNLGTLQASGWPANPGPHQDPQTSTKIAESPIRDWTSADGRYKQAGKLVEQVNESVRIESRNGEIVVVAINKLCEDDRKFIQKEVDRASKETNPFMVENRANAGKSSEQVSNTPSAKQPARTLDFEPNLVGLPEIRLETETPLDLQSGRWRLPVRESVKPFRFPAISVHARIMGTAVNPKENLLAVSLHEPFGIDLVGTMNASPSRRGSRGVAGSTKSWVEIVELPNGTTKGRYAFPSERTVVGDIDDTGKRLLAYDGPFSRDPRIYVFQCQDLQSGQTLTLETSWFSIHKNGRSDKAVGARLLTDNHVAVEYSGHLQVWQLEPLEPKHSVSNDAKDWKLAADRRHALIGQGNQTFEVDLISAECTGKLGEAVQSTLGTRSPDGTQFAKLNRSRVTIFDAQGNMASDFYVPLALPGSAIVWTDEKTLRLESLNSITFVDLPRRASFLEISNTRQDAPLSGWQIERTEQDRTPYVSVSQLNSPIPPSLDLESYRNKLPIDPASLEILKAGDRVRLTLDLEAAPEKTDTIRQLIEKMLHDRGVIINETATDEVRAISRKRDEEMDFRRLGASPWSRDGVEKVTVHHVDQRLEFVRKNAVVFRFASSSGSGFMLSIRDGETPQQAADRQVGNSVNFWRELALPKTISIHPKSRAWTRLARDPNGFTEVKD